MVDPMHAVYLGCVKRAITRLIDDGIITEEV